MKDTIPLNEALELTINLFQEQSKKLSFAMQIIEKLEESNAFYAVGGSDLEPRPEKKHLYEKDFSMDSHEWRQRSMSDYWSGFIARQTIKEVEELKKGLK